MGNNSPLFECVSCYGEQSFPAKDLRVHDDSLWCEDCWNGHEMNTEFTEYADLPIFVPEAELRINALTVSNLRLQAINSELVDALAAIVDYKAEQHDPKGLMDADHVWHRASTALKQAREQAKGAVQEACPTDCFPVSIETIMNAASDNMSRSHLWRFNTIQAFKVILSTIPLDQRLAGTGTQPKRHAKESLALDEPSNQKQGGE